MELKQLEKTQETQPSNKDNVKFLHVIANLNPCLAEDETLLLYYYNKVKTTWSSSAIKSLQKETGLKLTSKLNRCRFAIAAAKFQLNELQVIRENIDVDIDPTSKLSTSCEVSAYGAGRDEIVKHLEELLLDSEKQLKIKSEQVQLLESQLLNTQEELEVKEEQLEEQSEQLNQIENFSILLLTHRLLAPGLPLNGTEESPAMRILGSPKTRTELEANYRELIKREHPDVSAFDKDTAIARFSYVRSIALSDNQGLLGSLETYSSHYLRRIEDTNGSTSTFSPFKFLDIVKLTLILV